MMQSNRFSLTLRFVADVAASVDFYARLIGARPVEQSSGFAMFALPGGHRLGLWQHSDVEPAPDGRPGAEELVYDQPDDAAVDKEAARWAAEGFALLQKPTRMDFGYTAATCDPDGHRIRTYKVAPDPR